MRRWPFGLALWFVLLAGAEVACFVAVWRFFVLSEHGQLLDTVALSGNTVGPDGVGRVVGSALNAISAVSLLIATAVVGFIGLIRRRVAVAIGAVLLIVGANVTTQLLKVVITRPELGVDVERAAAGNSLPSGHATVAASVVVALMLVLPVAMRGVAGVLGAVVAAAVGVATISAGWHRPSDAVAALLIVGGWACAAGLVIVAAQRGHGGVEYGPGHRLAAVWLTVAGLAALVGAGLAVEFTDQALATPPEELGRLRLSTAYIGGALGIAGTAGVVMASVLATLHRVVPLVAPSSGGTPHDAATPVAVG